MFNDKIRDLIATETKRYVKQHDLFYLQQPEIDTFIATILMTSYNSRPRQRLYWSKDGDVAIPLISKSMSRKRFEDINKFIHFANNDDLTAGDKLAKILPLQDKIIASVQQFGLFGKRFYPLTNKWYHTLEGTPQRCLFKASR